ncbi:hypothetical protein [Smaragdicoccus niigatensis]|uniref:hypothetical protein n=1 Tax=Smaragdicoccus niigatensis TaxID=359359 RepID=UPI00036C47AD|nr:hypothetical protein [Smaragdicoccus niigatensis]
MFTTSTRRRIVFSAIAGTAVVATMAGLSGVATAGTLPTDVPTTAMTITNNTGHALTIDDANIPYGYWIAAPRESLAPGQTEIITGASNNRAPVFPISISYQMDTNTIVKFVSTNDYMGANTDGSNVSGPGASTYTVQSTIDTGAPNVNASYVLSPLVN